MTAPGNSLSKPLGVCRRLMRRRPAASEAGFGGYLSARAACKRHALTRGGSCATASTDALVSARTCDCSMRFEYACGDPRWFRLRSSAAKISAPYRTRSKRRANVYLMLSRGFIGYFARLSDPSRLRTMSAGQERTLVTGIAVRAVGAAPRVTKTRSNESHAATLSAARLGSGGRIERYSSSSNSCRYARLGDPRGV
jgi:hypothetical protein